MRRIPTEYLLAGIAVAGACGDDARDLVGPAPTGLVLVVEVPIPPNYGIHDTYVRDGIAFVCAWNSGVILYDVGGGSAGGTPQQPVELSRIVTNPNGVGGARAHNAWWFHNPNTGERRYLFVGQEGPGQLGVSSSGDIHVLDVSDLANPREVASYTMDGTGQPAGAHNFWMDEAAEILYAAYYNGGVVALDVSGTLSGTLTNREIDRIRPSGDSTYVWGVQVHDRSIYVTDMLSGFIQLQFTGDRLLRVGGGHGTATERFSSDLWVHGNHAFTGTWGNRGSFVGDVINVWLLNDLGRPSLVRSVKIDRIGSIADLEVSADGTALLVSTERGENAGLHLFDGRSNPAGSYRDGPDPRRCAHGHDRGLWHAPLRVRRQEPAHAGTGDIRDHPIGNAR